MLKGIPEESAIVFPFAPGGAASAWADWCGDLPFSHGRKFETSDYARARRCVERTSSGTLSLSARKAGEFRFCQFKEMSLEDIRFDFISVDSGTGYNIEMERNRDIIQLHFLFRGDATLRQGPREVRGAASQLILLEPSVRTQKEWFGHVQFLMLRISRARLEQIARSEIAIHADCALDFGTMQVYDFSRIVTLLNYVVNVCHDLGGSNPCFDGPVGRTAAQALMLLLLKSIPNNYSPYFTPSKSASAAAPFYVRRVERFVSDNAHRPIRFNDLVEASGVSPRSLHLGFQRFRSTTPMNFLKAARLDRARSAFVNPLHDSAIGVTRIALEVGYTNLSQFSRDYRERFGETPSATLMNASLITG